ncbi:MerR family transcriptional regulator [Deinococcus hopiensis]|uniref:DNA-binding transcriptional regulator, MerR family n=1 Tax=Deinococcus hopiensis KR-140 TaxID=695939 RepID=A0A1W1UWW5_9DEIO|nr:MerR family transcriptional regulator [Deinococcus hopiensis]SMB85526.1 DNA-binding transcriptional regulator, MerR family [Deinococcus hopiensis KR-140]
MQGRLIISRFALLTGLPPKTLRYYDEIGLLHPRWVEENTGYRYYSAAQISLGVRIRQWRQMDLPLEDIRQMLQSPAHANDVLRQHEQRLRHEIAARERALLHLRTSLQENTMEYRLEHLPTLQTLSIRTLLHPPHYEVIPEALQELMAYKKSQSYELAAPSFFVHHNEAEGEQGVVEICLPVTGGVEPQGRIEVRTFEGRPAFIGRFVGPYDKTGEAYTAVVEEALRRGLNITGSTAEIYVKSVPDIPDSNAYETDIAFFLQAE